MKDVKSSFSGWLRRVRVDTIVNIDTSWPRKTAAAPVQVGLNGKDGGVLVELSKRDAVLLAKDLLEKATRR